MVFITVSGEYVFRLPVLSSTPCISERDSYYCDGFCIPEYLQEIEGINKQD